MSQRKRQRANRSQKRSSQPGTSRQQTLNEYFSQTQSDIEEDVSEDVLHDCVRYFVLKAGSNSVIRKPDFQKILQGSRHSFGAALSAVKKILEETYGYTISCHEQSASTKFYFVIDNLPYKEQLFVETFTQEDSADEEDEIKTPSDIHKTLKLLILTHVFMSGKKVTEESLFSYLLQLDINIDAIHQDFGNIKEYLNEMVKQKYLNYDKEERTNCYSWGSRSELEVPQLKILEFVCKIYGENQPQTWTEQFQESQTQELERQV